MNSLAASLVKDLPKSAGRCAPGWDPLPWAGKPRNTDIIERRIRGAWEMQVERSPTAMPRTPMPHVVELVQYLN
jgi:hypothetical protein